METKQPGGLKKLLTSCYSRSRHIPPDKTQVQTSRSVPNWWIAERKAMEWDLAPTREIFEMAKKQPGSDWRGAYRKHLQGLYDRGVLAEIVARLPEGSVLMCWEGDCKDCHRGVLAEFLNGVGLASVSEFPAPAVAEKRVVKRKSK